MKNYLWNNKEKIKRKADVWEYCNKYWQSKECRELIIKCIKSIPERVKALKRLKGNQIDL